MTCENCYSPHLDDRKKIIYQGMEFCSIECFLNSRYFDIETLDEVATAKEDAANAFEDFKKSEDEKATLEALHKTMCTKIEELLSSYDNRFEQGNTDLDAFMLELTIIKQDCEA